MVAGAFVFFFGAASPVARKRSMAVDMAGGLASSICAAKKRI